MTTRRQFLKTSALALAGSTLSLSSIQGHRLTAATMPGINRHPSKARMKLRYFPYELKLRHVFTVATYSKTPDQLGFCVGRADLETTRAMALGNAIPYVAYRA